MKQPVHGEGLPQRQRVEEGLEKKLLPCAQDRVLEITLEPDRRASMFCRAVTSAEKVTYILGGGTS